MEKVYRYIEDNQDMYIEWLRELCRQPSVSAQNRGMKEMVELVKKYLHLIGTDITIIETSGYPIVYGEINQNKNKTLSFYNHYDVQPEDPIELWDMDPYGAIIKDGKLYARGSSDNKGNLIARICAVHAYQQVYGKLPLNVKFIFEGEEEIGSPHLTDFANNHPEKLETDGIIWEGGSRGADGRLHVTLGVKGICYVELVAKGANTDLHSSEAAIIVNPAWRLIWALNTLKDENENILIEGFYDKVVQPNEIDRKFLKEMDFDEQYKLKTTGLDQFLLGVTGDDLKERLLYHPTCTICGMESGYIDEGSKTVLPSKAIAKIDFRLVPDQEPDDIVALLRKHLDKHGFSDIEIVRHSSKNPYKTDPDNPLAKTVIENVDSVYHKPPVIYRNSPGSSPIYDFCSNKDIPVVQIGVAHEDSRFHAPNENIYIKDYIDGIKMTATVIHEFAKEK
ncbi:MAG TPA: M20/M25/M40 family metallo-hydrolase [Thermoanaerobacterales bacterium]|nr:M20/M25/M40 family metallo-hydrolase [Thermoanaerobacterales bacterium]